ncbi:hypothetical protein OKW29_008314 [Paraburkholderia sp. CI3]
MNDRRESAFCAGMDVRGATHDHRGDRQAADRTRDQIAHALRLQLAIGRRAAALRIDLFDRFEAQ